MAVQVTARAIQPDDEPLCQQFDCGSEEYQRDVSGFLREKIWRGDRPQTERTLLLLTAQAGDLVGFGTWKIRRDVKMADSDERIAAIDVAYFGLDRRFWGEEDLNGQKLSRVLFATLDADARRHPDGADLPMHLVCDTRNEAGLAFWRGRGFEDVQRLDFDDVSYFRMFRAA